jgi:hypothetical protein
MELETKDVNEFLIEWLWKIIRYWSLVHLSLLSKALVVNLMLTSSQMFREDYEKSKKKCKVILRNFLLWCNEHATRARVQWEDVCMCLKVWGFKHQIPQRSHGNYTLQMVFVCIKTKRIQFEYSIQIDVGMKYASFYIFY